MTLPQKIIHFLGQSTGYLQKVFKLLRKKPKSNLISSEESSKMSKETPSQDLVYDSIRAYREAALSDSYMFGEYDGYQAYKGDE